MKLKYTGLLIALAGLLISGCKKQQTSFTNPYSGGKSALAIVTNQQQVPVPASGGAGTVVTITATGLEQYKGKLHFLFNGLDAKIDEITSTGIKVEVPNNASSGVTSFVVDGELVFGPIFSVTGKMNIDPTYENTYGADNAVWKAFPIPLSSNLFILGSFSNYDNKGVVRKINRIARVAVSDGAWDRSFASGAGANNTIYDIAQIGGYFFPVGEFSSYAQQGNMNGITRIFSDGKVDTMQVTTYLKHLAFVPTFNGAVAGGGVRSIYGVGNNKMIITGDFLYYTKRIYDANTYNYKDSTVVDSTYARKIIRLNLDGSLDKTWRFDPNAAGYKNRPGRTPDAANGSMSTLMDKNSNILVYGTFNTFDGTPAGYITRLTSVDGKIDPTFNAGGKGADYYIGWMSYNAVQNKYIAVGLFNNYNGTASQYMVQLNYDGSIDNTFKPKAFDGGQPSFVKMLDDGLIIVNGTFKSYGGIMRNGLAVLTPTGDLADNYNNVGSISGQLLDVLDTKTADNKRALLLMGSFYSFDSKPHNNIIRVTFE